MNPRQLSLILLLLVFTGHPCWGQQRFPGQHSATAATGARIYRLPPPDHAHDAAASGELQLEPSKPDFARLLRPSLTTSVDWMSEAGGVQMAFYDAKLRVPTYPVWGPPPPLVNIGFTYTNLHAPVALELPTDLYDYSLGFSWTRPINDRWVVQSMFSTALATDGRNQSNDAWQFRGGLFAIYRPNERWTWIAGALALGRQDLPVVPAVGVVWQPEPSLRLDFTLPNPRIAWQLADNGNRQQWAYLGTGFYGRSWAVERPPTTDDQLTYRDWRVVLGWESIPSPEPGSTTPFAPGRKLSAEVGYVFGREFQFESQTPDIGLDDGIFFRGSVHF